MRNGARWSVVLWDLDGTLLDSIPSIVRAHHVATEELLGIRLDDSAILRRIGEPARRRIEALVPDRSDDVLARYSKIVEHLGAAAMSPIGGIRGLVRELAASGSQQAVVTSRPRRQAEAAIQFLGLAEFFSSLVGLEDTSRHKPDPAPLLRALDELSVERWNTVYVGDAVVDIVAAQSASIDSVAVTWGAGSAEELLSARPTMSARSVAELRSILFGQRAAQGEL